MNHDLPPLIYNLCFLTRGDQVLMLLRNKPPNRGLWNGVGGHIEPGESPLDSVLREVAEETGYRLPTARFCGLLTWEDFEIPTRGSPHAPLLAAGLYIFTAPAPEGEPHPTVEGKLAWKDRAYIFSSPEVVSNIHRFGPRVLDGAPPQVYHFAYRTGEILRHEVYPLPEGFHI